MHYVWIIFIGLVLGAISGFLTKGRNPGSIVMSTLVGIFGAIVTSVLMPPIDNSILFSALVIIVLLFIYRLIVGKRKTT
jgi:uncharacterized membrane protein YeaQ/YmgE (transglycosylase-associated protein family)